MTEMNKPVSTTKDVVNGLTFVFNFGFVMLVPALLGLWGGLLLDRKFQSKPWFTVSLLLIGVVFGTYAAVQQVKRYLLEANKKDVQNKTDSFKKNNTN